jgi:hypothetical protein
MPDQALFIGHSLVGPTMPNMFNDFTGSAWEADAQVINGAPLRWGWDNGGSAEGVNARAVLPSGVYDAVIVTEALPLADQIRWNDTEGYAKRYFDLAISANPNTQFYIYETWHSMGSDTAAWRAQIAPDLSAWEGIVDHINATSPAWAPEALIVPAGQALGALHDAIEAGRVPGLSSIRDLFSDDIHLNDIGNWFIAAVQANVVAGVDTASAPLQTFAPWGAAYGGPSAAMAAAMDRVIDETLASYQRDGVEGGGGSAPAPAPVVTPDPDPEPEPVTPAPVTPDPAPFEPAPVVPAPAPAPGGNAITGNWQDNDLYGTAADDVILGLGGSDWLIGQQGDDFLDGGDGWDLAIYDTSLSNLTLTVDASGLTVEDRRGDAGRDTLVNIEGLSYQGGQLDLTQLTGAATLSAEQMESLIELYIAYFNRAPDALGLSFWGTAHANGMSLSEIASQFTYQEETRGMYAAGMSDADFVSTVYNNVLGRTGDGEGFAFWSTALARGDVARDQFIVAVLEGAKAAPASGMSAELVAQQNADRLYLSDKIELGAYFAVHRGLTDLGDAAAVMAAYDGTGAGYNAAIGLSDLASRNAVLGHDDTFLMPTVGVLEAPAWW